LRTVLHRPQRRHRAWTLYLPRAVRTQSRHARVPGEGKRRQHFQDRICGPESLGSRGKSMSKPLALVIDDEPDICELLGLTLGRMNIETDVASDVTGAKQKLGRRKFDICLTDM